MPFLAGPGPRLTVSPLPQGGLAQKSGLEVVGGLLIASLPTGTVAGQMGT